MGTHVQKNQHMACLTGLPTGLNSTRLGHTLAWWVGGLLDQPVGIELFDDP